MSNAISAQGTRLMIQAEAAGAAATVSAVTKASPGVVTTSAAHGLTNGDVGAFATVGGMTQLNGKTYVVKVLSTTTFSLVDAQTGVDVDTTNFGTFTSGGTFTPITWVETEEHKTYAFNPSPRAELNKTTLRSTAKEYVAGLDDFGGLTVGMNIVSTEPAQQRFHAARKLQDLWFRIIDPLGAVKVFRGLVRAFGESGGVDAVAEGSLDIRVTGEIIRV